MGRGYEREMRFYVSIVTEREENADGHMVAKGDPQYIMNEEFTTTMFILAQHFPSFEIAKAEAELWKTVHPDWTFIIRSLYVEVNGFDLGAIV